MPSAWLLRRSKFQFSCSVVSDSLQPHGQQHTRLPSLSPNSQSLLCVHWVGDAKLVSIGLVMPSNHLILCRPLPFPPSIFPGIRVFSNELVLPIRWPKYWSFSFSISPSNEYSGLKVKLLSRFRLFATPWTEAYQAPQSMEFSRQEYWSGLPFPSPEDLPNPGSEPRSPALQADALP